MPSPKPILILASGSAARVAMLRQAGIEFDIFPAVMDEEEVRHSFRADGIPVDDCAIALAELKAAQISRRCSGAYVLGADQMLECAGEWYGKPKTAVMARQQLRKLSGKTHHLISAAVVIRNGARIWHCIETCEMTIRQLSDEFITRYLEENGDDILATVGCYQIEKSGVQLFERIRGDFFAIQGLPLVQLLAYLREIGLAER